MSQYKSRKAAPSQRQISSFFLPAKASGSCQDNIKLKRKQNPSSPVFQSVDSVKTPEQLPKIKSSESVLTKSHQKLSAFDELCSSETSFDSPEVTNFLNPALNRYSSIYSGLPEKKHDTRNQDVLVISSDSEGEKENTLQATRKPLNSSPLTKPSMKRAQSSTFFEALESQPKKVLKKNTTQIVTTLAKPGSENVYLSEEQAAIVRAVVHDGHNVFFTGSAGTGKSVVLRELVGGLYKKHGRFLVGVTASTGLAACNIQGQTLHKFLSIGLGTGSPQDLALKIKRNAAAKKRWTQLAVLVIDEILMIDGTLFTKIDEIAQILKSNQRPFGGIQIVCCGDFYQLPPVSRDRTCQYCFQSPSWRRAMSLTLILNKVFRQKGDDELIDMLNALREGTLDNRMVMSFKQLLRRVSYSDGIEPTELFPTRAEVKRANENRLHQLKGKIHTFDARDSDKSPQVSRLYENLMCEQRLELKEGAQVMYLKNHSETNVVNGSIGTIVGFLPESLFGSLFSQFHSFDFINASPEFILMIHLVCGLIGKTEFSSEQRIIFDTLPDNWKPKVSSLIRDAYLIGPQAELLPVVNFKTNTDFTMILVKKEEFSVDQGRVPIPGRNVTETLTREQLPLLLAWAMSIHKAQGQSIERLRVDLRKVFEKGQIYVALSRATNKQLLEVWNFDALKVSVSEDVKNFYRTLTSAVRS